MAYTATYKRSLFEFKKLSLVILTPMPLDVTGGLVLKSSFLSVSRVGSLVSVKDGLGGEHLISENLSGKYLLNLTYLPSAEALPKLDLLKKAKTQFGFYISNESTPNYKGMASECRFIEESNIEIGDGGYFDFTFAISMTDFVDIFTGFRF